MQARSGTDLALTEEEKEVVELLSPPKPKWWLLEEAGKQKIRNFLQHLHLERGISLTDLGKLVGKSSGYMSYMARKLGIKPRDFEEARLKGIHEKVRKYERKPFDGTDEDKAYLLGLRHGDLSAYVPFGDVTRVSTSTTHPALADLFTNLFSPYGHVYKHPRYKKDTKSYEWNFQAILDESFGFLLDTRDKWREWIASKDSRMLSYLAGLVDAEGNVGIYPNSRTTAITVAIHNTDQDLVGFVHRCLTQLGYNPLAPYLAKRAGFISPGFHIAMKKDYYRVLIATFEYSQALLRNLPLRHREKTDRKELALSIPKGQPWKDIKDKVWTLAD